MPRQYSDDEIKEIAKEILEALRPKHLAVFQIRKVAAAIVELTDYIVLREISVIYNRTRIIRMRL